MIKKCIMCGEEFEARRRQATCSTTCSHARLRQLTNLRAARYKEQARREAMRSVVIALLADYQHYGIEYVLAHYRLIHYNKDNTKQGEQQ